MAPAFGQARAGRHILGWYFQQCPHVTNPLTPSNTVGANAGYFARPNQMRSNNLLQMYRAAGSHKCERGSMLDFGDRQAVSQGRVQVCVVVLAAIDMAWCWVCKKRHKSLDLRR